MPVLGLRSALRLVNTSNFVCLILYVIVRLNADPGLFVYLSGSGSSRDENLMCPQKQTLSPVLTVLHCAPPLHL